MHSQRHEWVATDPEAEHWELGVMWLSTRLDVRTDCLLMTGQWGTPACENSNTNITCFKNYLELSINAEHMHIGDATIWPLDMPKRKMFSCSPKDTYKTVHVSTTHNSSKLEINQMSNKIQMDRNNCSRKYYIAMKMNKVLLYGTTWINLTIIMLGERRQTWKIYTV